MRRLNASSLFAIAAICLSVAACRTLSVPPMAVISAEPLLPVDKLADTPTGKTFTLRGDWAHGAWVIKKGASITFQPDGIGRFSAVVYCREDVGVDEIRFQAIQYGADGNTLFAFPDNPVGYPLHVRSAAKDFPYDVSFGFDPRYFNSIEESKFFARLRLHEGSVANPAKQK